MNGSVQFLAICDSAGGAMQARECVMAIASLGLAGDRYANKTGHYSNWPSPGGGRALTLIEAEVLEAIEAETGIALTQGEHRRNITSRGITLDTLIGRRFLIGDVLCEGVRPCEPCAYLEQLTGKSVLRPLAHRGGLRANILSTGSIRVGDLLVTI
jgi:MOSC domain-containing protein YiiM